MHGFWVCSSVALEALVCCLSLKKDLFTVRNDERRHRSAPKCPTVSKSALENAFAPILCDTSEPHASVLPPSSSSKLPHSFCDTPTSNDCFRQAGSAPFVPKDLPALRNVVSAFDHFLKTRSLRLASTSA